MGAWGVCWLKHLEEGLIGFQSPWIDRKVRKFLAHVGEPQMARFCRPPLGRRGRRVSGALSVVCESRIASE